MALTLNFEERRVLGVLMEKALSTPQQYPLTLQALVAGSNQKSCRDPIARLGEENVLDVLDSLRRKELVTLVRTAGGRTDRFKHRAADKLEVEGREGAVLAELLLRGPQTDSELRQRATRMVPIPGFPELAAALENLRNRNEPLVRRLSPEGRTRGVKYAHTLYPPGKEPDDEPARSVHSEVPVDRSPAPNTAVAELGTAVDELRAEVEELRAEIDELKARVAELETEVGRLRGM